MSNKGATVKRWTTGDLALIGQAWRDGYSAGLIAQMTGTTRNQIIGVAHRHGFRRALPRDQRFAPISLKGDRRVRA